MTSQSQQQGGLDGNAASDVTRTTPTPTQATQDQEIALVSTIGALSLVIC